MIAQGSTRSDNTIEQIVVDGKSKARVGIGIEAHKYFDKAAAGRQHTASGVGDTLTRIVHTVRQGTKQLSRAPGILPEHKAKRKEMKSQR